MTTSRRLAPLPLMLIALCALLALVLGGVLLWSTPAEAQTTPRILVSNVSQGSDDDASTSGNDHAQLFHTAGATNGYTLTSVIVVRGHRGRRLRSRDLRGGRHDRVSNLDLHGAGAAGELRGREPGVHAPGHSPQCERQLRGGDQAGRQRERHARLHHLLRRRLDRPHGVKHQRQVRLEQRRHLAAKERGQRGYPDHRQWLCSAREPGRHRPAGNPGFRGRRPHPVCRHFGHCRQ